MQLLHVDSSILGSHSASRALSAEIAAAELGRAPGARLVYRDLAAEPLGHISGQHLALAQGRATAADLPMAIQLDVSRGSADLEAFLASDVIVIGAPMYNFTIPTQLKAWIDRLAVAGKTFSYGADGVKGLAGGKKVIIASARGGVYSANSPMAFLDHQENYLRAIFGFFGISNIQFIRAEGLAKTDHRENAIAAARAQIASLV